MPDTLETNGRWALAGQALWTLTPHLALWDTSTPRLAGCRRWPLVSTPTAGSCRLEVIMFSLCYWKTLYHVSFVNLTSAIHILTPQAAVSWLSSYTGTLKTGQGCLLLL